MKKKSKILIAVVALLAIFISSGVGYYFLVMEKEENGTLSKGKVIDPSLYQACDEDSCIYLLGTIHMGDEHLAGLTDKIWNAYQDSDAIAFELDITTVSAENSEELVMLPENDDLSNYLTEEQFNDLQKFFAKRLIPMDVLRHFNLAGVASLLGELVYLELGYTSNNGVDIQLLNRAHSDNKEIIELETYEMQASLLYQFDNELYIRQIDETLENYSIAKISTKLLYDCYLSGNAFVLRTLLGDTDTDDELEREYNQKMLVDRNKAMAEKAETYLKENKKVMVAVGAAHVIGDTGIIELLTEKGYKISLVK